MLQIAVFAAKGPLHFLQQLHLGELVAAQNRKRNDEDAGD